MLNIKHVQNLHGRFKYQECEKYLVSFLNQHPRDRTALYYLALTYDQWAASRKKVIKEIRELQQKAMQILQRGLRQYPGEPRLLHTKGLLFLHRRQPKRALDYFHRAYALSRRDPAYLLSIANAQRRLGRFQQAIQNYRRASRRGINPLLIHHNLANTHLALKKLANARQQAEKGLLLLRRKRMTPFERKLGQDLRMIVRKTS